MEIELKDIHKYYGSVRANDGINLFMKAGKIHGVLGENGAGKSTLMKILAGYCRKTRGTIISDGREIELKNPAHAAEVGIGMLYQDPMDFPSLSVLDNFMLRKKGLFFDNKRKNLKIFKELNSFFNFDLPPHEAVNSLGPGERQQLELLRLLSLGTQILILDEPTTGISAQQKETLFQALKKIAAEGRSVVLVSHKLSDINALCDSATVLRDGKVAGECKKPFKDNDLLEMMFGILPGQPSKRFDIEFGREVLVMENVHAGRGRNRLKNCSVRTREKQIIGLAGLEGSGQNIFLRAASGLSGRIKGKVVLCGKFMKKHDYHFFNNNGVVFLPGARLEEGLIAGLTVSEHFILKTRRRGLFLARKDAEKLSAAQIERFQIKGSHETKVESLSGGNMQRLLISLLPENPKLLLLENPTRGLDLESAQRIWRELQSYVAEGVSVVFSSPDLDEIVYRADRVLVFFNGSIIRDVKANDTNIGQLGRDIAGADHFVV